MDDLKLVRELDDTPLKSADQLRAARAQFVAGMAAPRRGRAGIITIATLAAAASVAAAVTLVLPSGSPDAPAGQAAPETPVVDTAVQLLSQAAAVARSAPEVVPRPDQFYYVRDADGWEAWFSVDGTRDGQIIPAGSTDPVPVPGCVDGVRQVLDKFNRPTGTEPCKPERRYRDDLPADAGTMLELLQGDAPDRAAESFGKDVGTMFAQSYLPGPQRAALFEAATKVPGLELVKDVSSGRPGVGITWPAPKGSKPGSELVLVFDPNTYEYLGLKDKPLAGSGFVDRVGDRI